ncbi:MAG: hypothetical protein V7K47_24545 [Nostoc sp.]
MAGRKNELAPHLSADFEVELLVGDRCSSFYHPASGIPRTKARQILNSSAIVRLKPC